MEPSLQYQRPGPAVDSSSQWTGISDANAGVEEGTRNATFRDVEIKGHAQVHLGDQYHRNHGVIINTTGNVGLSEFSLHSLTRFGSSPPLPRKTFGLCLGQAPQIEPDAFIGRVVELQQLKEWLTPDGNTQKIVSIVGMGGLGKTQLSLTYARENKHQYTSIFWVNAKDELSLRQSLRALANVVLPNDPHPLASAKNDSSGDQARVEALQRWLSEEWNSQWLVIFDNYDDPALPSIRSSTGFDIRSYFPYVTQGHILITTRSPRLTFSKRLMLQKFNDIDSSLDILSHRAGRDLSAGIFVGSFSLITGLTEALDINSQSLASRFDGLPLALATAGVYLGQTGVSCAEYLQMYESAWSELHDQDAEELLEYEDRTLSSTWLVSFDQVRKVDADAAELLKLWAFFSNKDLRYDLIYPGASNGPAWMGRVTRSKIHFDRAMTRLRNYSLVEVATDSYSIHPCVHDWLTEQFVADPAALAAASHCITSSIPKRYTTDYWTATRHLLAHVRRLAEERFQAPWEMSMSDEAVVFNSITLGQVLNDWDYPDQAEGMYTRALAGYRQNADGHHTRMILKIAKSLGKLYMDQCRWALAETMYRRALKGYEVMLGPDDIETLDTLRSLGCVFYREGKLRKAHEILQKALNGLELVLGTSHPVTLQTLATMGVLYVKQGNSTEALRIQSRLLAGWQTYSGQDHPTILEVLHSLAVMYKDQGKLAESEDTLLKTVAGSHKLFGLDNTSTLDALNDLGALYRYQDKLDEADELFSRVVSVAPRNATIALRTNRAITELFQVLSKRIKTNAHDPTFAKHLLARLIRLPGTTPYGSNSAYQIYYLARALLWIDDAENFSNACAQNTVGLCNGCWCEIGSNRGHHICYQCPEVDLCDVCLAKYEEHSLKVADCGKHKFFNARSAKYRSSEMFVIRNGADMSAWLDRLKVKYPLQDIPDELYKDHSRFAEIFQS